MAGWRSRVRRSPQTRAARATTARLPRSCAALIVGPLYHRASRPRNDLCARMRAAQALEQGHLIARPRRRAELVCIQARARGVELEPRAGDGEAPRDELGIDARALHAPAERGVVVLAPARLADQAHDVLGPFGVVALEPFLEQVAHLERQAHENVAGEARAGLEVSDLF